jgi:hypothetical protein
MYKMTGTNGRRMFGGRDVASNALIEFELALGRMWLAP